MDFIYINENSIPLDLCKEIIDIFENEPNKYKGVTRNGQNDKIKKTMDYSINININETSAWFNVNKFLYEELSKNLKIFNNNLCEKYGKTFFNQNFCDTCFLMQKYDKNEGVFIYHDDFSMVNDMKMHRVITYLWYLNDVDEGGETEFCGDFKIKPTAGKLIFFPASWCYPHKGIMPLSNNKYIITGWLYIQ